MATTKVTVPPIDLPEMPMKGLRPVLFLLGGLTLTGCTSDPDAAVNQTPPIRQMDRFFDSLFTPSRSAYDADPDYTHRPGYAPAYPPY